MRGWIGGGRFPALAMIVFLAVEAAAAAAEHPQQNATAAESPASRLARARGEIAA